MPMFARKLQKFLAHSGRHDQSAVLYTLSPTQQVTGLQCVENIAPQLLLFGGVIMLAPPREGIKFLILILAGLLLARPCQNLLAGADAAYAAGFVGAPLLGWRGIGIFLGFIGYFACSLAEKQPVDEPHERSPRHEYCQ